MCGACSCITDGIVRVSDAEIAAVLLGMDEAVFIACETDVAPDRKGLILQSRPDGSCAYLTEESRCRINPVKPDKCRTFSFEWTSPDSSAVCPALAASPRISPRARSLSSRWFALNRGLSGYCTAEVLHIHG